MRKMTIFAMFFIFVPPSNAYQEPNRLPASVKRQTFEIGPEMYYFRYEEPGLMKTTGKFKGIKGTYTSHEWMPETPVLPFNNGKLMVEGRFASGSADFDGQVLGGAAVNTDNFDAFTTEFRFLIGMDELKQNRTNTFYAGLGIRYFNDKGPRDAVGYNRESTYCYVPIGLKTDRLLKYGWSFSATGEFDFFLIDLFLVDDDEDEFNDDCDTDVEDRHLSGMGLRGSFSFEKQFKGSSFKVEPFVRFWYIPEWEEDEHELGFEPENNTLECGVQLIWTF